MIEEKEVTRPDGTKLKIPVYDLYNKKENFLLGVWGIDFDVAGSDWYFGERVEAMLIGKLNNVTYLSNLLPINLLRNVLVEAGWDFVRYPNPELIIIRERRGVIFQPHDLKTVH